jgi:hypothetical protein
VQTIVQVICLKGESLRDSIVNDSELSDFGLAVHERLKRSRSKGWAKIRSSQSDRRGALNIEWNPDTHILLCRIVNRGDGRPDLILGDFVSYLFQRYRRRIKMININSPR